MYIYVLGDEDFKYCIFGLLRYRLPPFLKMAVVKTNVTISQKLCHRAIMLTLLNSLLDSDVNGSIIDIHQPLNYRHYFNGDCQIPLLPYLKKYVNLSPRDIQVSFSTK